MYMYNFNYYRAIQLVGVFFLIPQKHFEKYPEILQPLLMF